jgi:hypothetical protein
MSRNIGSKVTYNIGSQGRLYPSLWLGLLVLGGVGLLGTPGTEGSQVTPAPEVAPPPRPDPVAEWIDYEGSFDYAAAVNAVLGRGVTPKNNAVVLLWEALGPTPQRGNPLPLEYFEYLGIPRPTGSHEDFIGLYRFSGEVLRLAERAMEQLDDQLNMLMSIPWKDKEAPELSAWLDRNEKALERVRQATDRPYYFNPAYRLDDNGNTVALYDNLLPQAQALRDVIRALNLRAMRKLGQGDTAGAWQDILTSYRLCRQLTQGTCLIEAIIGASFERVTFKTTRAFLEHASLTPRQLAQCLQQLQQLSETNSLIQRSLISEMAATLDYLQHKAPKNYVETIGIIHEFFSSTPPPHPRGLEDLPITVEGWVALQREIITHFLRWKDYFAQRRTSRYDPKELEALKPKPEFLDELRRELEHEIALWKKQERPDAEQTLQLQRRAGRYVGRAIVSMPVMDSSRLDQIYWMRRQCMELLQVAFALELYRSEQGRYPQQLAQLADKYLPEVPPDRFRDHPLQYHLSPEVILMYSVGLNGKDDAGRSRYDNPEEADADDLVVRLRPRLKP